MKDMYKAANWNGKGFASRQNLMEKLQSNQSLILQIRIVHAYCFSIRISPTGHNVTTKTT
jgi:hypothetical protein